MMVMINGYNKDTSWGYDLHLSYCGEDDFFDKYVDECIKKSSSYDEFYKLLEKEYIFEETEWFGYYKRK